MPQIQNMLHPIGFYCSRRRPGDEVIDWRQESRALFNFIRALCRPGPMALSFVHGCPLKINAARMLRGAPVYKDIPGAVVGLTHEGFLVKTLDQILEMYDYEYFGQKISVGDRLSMCVEDVL